MKISKHVILSAALVVLAAGCLTGSAMAQDAQQQAKPMFKVMPAHNTFNFTTTPPPVALKTFSSTFTYSSHSYPFTMVGFNPGTTRTKYSVATPTFIIPIKIVIGSNTFDPNHNLGTQTVIQNVEGSPMFVASNWTLGTHHLNNREYEDAYQVSSLWGLGTRTESTYHVRLDAPTVLPTVTLTCSSPNCAVVTNPITGHGTVAEVDINLMDSTIQNAINSNSSITPGTFPIALTYDTFLTEGGCCIGGYHSAYGGVGSQTYAHTTWIDPISCSGLCQFSEDVAAFSHETDEWIEDPYVNNQVPYSPCEGYLEVGDPLVEHDYIQVIAGYNYHVQDLVFFPYFYQTPSQAINGWYTFRNESGWTAPCSQGPVAK
jgi:hypothetical protein